MTVFIILDVILLKFLSFVARHWFFFIDIYQLMLFGIYHVLGDCNFLNLSCRHPSFRLGTAGQIGPLKIHPCSITYGAIKWTLATV
jgi:hypothetical protein